MGSNPLISLSTPGDRGWDDSGRFSHAEPIRSPGISRWADEAPDRAEQTPGFPRNGTGRPGDAAMILEMSYWRIPLQRRWLWFIPSGSSGSFRHSYWTSAIYSEFSHWKRWCSLIFHSHISLPESRWYIELLHGIISLFPKHLVKVAREVSPNI